MNYASFLIFPQFNMMMFNAWNQIWMDTLFSMYSPIGLQSAVTHLKVVKKDGELREPHRILHAVPMFKW